MFLIFPVRNNDLFWLFSTTSILFSFALFNHFSESFWFVVPNVYGQLLAQRHQPFIQDSTRSTITCQIFRPPDRSDLVVPRNCTFLAACLWNEILR